MRQGYASAAGTRGYAARFGSLAREKFFREAQDLTVSSVGIGSYLGEIGEAADAGYTNAFAAALRGGINFIDTSLNYRNQHSEQAIGRALVEFQRDEYVLCTKAGFLVPNAVSKGVLQETDIVAGMHSMAPAFLRDQLERSQINLGVGRIDVFYLHNPETQLAHMPRADFENRMRRAFETLEELASDGRISYYGAATWEGFRQKAGEGLSVMRLSEIAHEVAGTEHRFRFIQLPMNLAMTEAFTRENEVVNGDYVSVLDAAQTCRISVVASASILQSKLARKLPESLTGRIKRCTTNAQRAIQFTRSTPGIGVALVGMGNEAHVAENLGVGKIAPLTVNEYVSLFH